MRYPQTHIHKPENEKQVGQTVHTNRTWVGQMFAQGRETVSDQTWQKCVVSARCVPNCFVYIWYIPLSLTDTISPTPLLPIQQSNTYFAGFHLPGACRKEGLDWAEQLRWDEAIHVDETMAAMHHYRYAGWFYVDNL
jgi:hypothetical protein